VLTAIRLRINGSAVADDVLPRLRIFAQRRNLTGTHLGCEHGVVPARSS
jgi:aerobic-type carbon monoxide dehydrogenase small subunit (CoxS/CutS family)